MISLSNIKNVAVYERKTLFRSWFFRIFFIIALLAMLMINLIFFIFSGSSQWDLRALPANIPLLNILFLNVAQAVIAVFLASDFLKRDKKLDTAEVVYTRAISNSEYILGKTWGVLSVFLAMTLFFMVIALIFNLVIPDTGINYLAYIVYPLLITFPSLVFILGFSYLSMLIVKNQAVTFLVLIGYVALTLFYFGDKFYSMFDYMAFFTPMSFSESTGFANLNMLLAHRLFYLFLGLAFIAATINRFSRLPNRNYSKPVYLVVFLIFMGIGVGSGSYYWLGSTRVIDERETFLELNNLYSGSSRLAVTDVKLDVEHRGNGIEVTAVLSGPNPLKTSDDTLIFSLNPGFKLKDVTMPDGGKVLYEREHQIIKIFAGPNDILKDTLNYSFSYSGSVNEAFCYLDIAAVEYQKHRNVGPLILDKRFAYIENSNVVLTPETFWYPMAGVGFNVHTLKARPGFFSNYTLTVKTGKKLTVISQGEQTNTKNGVSSFKTTMPLKDISLIIGRYDTLSIAVDSTDYNLFYKPGNDFFSYHLPNLKDTLAHLIKTEKARYDNGSFFDVLPFNKIDIVEVPAHFQYYQRLMENTFETVQPGMVLYPERAIGLRLADFRRYKRFSRTRNSGETQRPIDAEVNVFRRFIGGTFFTNTGISQSSGRSFFSSSPLSISGIEYTLNPFSLFPMYFNHTNSIISDEYPLTEIIFANYLRESNSFNFGAIRGGMRDEEVANLLLQEKTLDEIISDPEKKNIVPKVIMQKGAFLVYGLKQSAGIFDFDDFLYDYFLEKRFTAICADSLKTRFDEEFEVDITPFLEQVSNKGDLPAYKFGQTLLIETRDHIGPVFLVKFKVSNVSDVEGVLDVTFRVAGGGMGGGSGEERIYLFEPGETKDIQVMLFDMPRLMMVNTVISKNIPASYNVFMRTAEPNFRMMPEEYAETVDEPVTIFQENEFVVDNEDPGFSLVQENTETKIKQYFDKLKKEEENKYATISSSYAPHYWRSVAHTAFNGAIIKSAYYTRNGKGERTATWRKELPEEGIYDVYVYIPMDAMLGRPGGDQGRGRGNSGGSRGSGGGGGPTFLDEGFDYQYFIYHGEEKEEVEFRLQNIVNGWNMLGTFMFQAGEAKIELTNKTSGNRVFADAVKWVKRD